ncbi:hypothetical protein BDA99DRAFT_499803 [Phascolomyces articulosus]|uniref:BZIP domain-containing protein n=1 Tax=Phascolomyces articulosus TaxID=60185 RepID=A0AAD5KJZ2_9FUNG|nr:hypothetical protein BDA99DRAFT_499803 [Phascolomyces articulosus]
MNAPNIIPLSLLPPNQQQPTLTPEQQQQFLQQRQQHPPLDANGQPVKIRKKPGRKPNPASPALRKAQNRAAQRAFRERKERHLRDLENTIRTLRDQRNSAAKELATVKSKLDGCKAENWYLRGVVLTLQFVCLHHHIHIPTHSPYLTEEALAEIAQTSPHAIEAYVNAYTRNNVDLKPTMATQFANFSKDEEEKENDAKSPFQHEDDMSSTQQQEEEQDEQHLQEQDEDDMMSEVMKADLSSIPDLISIPQHPPEPSATASVVGGQGSTIDPSMLHQMTSLSPSLTTETEDTLSKTTDHDLDKIKTEGHDNNNNGEEGQEPLVSSLGAIQKIRLQLRVQSALSNLGKSSTRLQPTLLQLAISHDPRIDLIPTPHMRDRMIIFRDLMDYDRCFSLLLNGAVYHGGDPTMSASWELPAEFFSEFWYLAINYDYTKTNKWRQMKGLPELEMGPKEGQNHTMEDDLDQTLWSDELFDQFTGPMPTLQPYSVSRPPKTPQSPQHQLESQDTTNSPSHPMYENLRSPPELRDPVQSPTLDTMMNLMNNLSTDS